VRPHARAADRHRQRYRDAQIIGPAPSRRRRSRPQSSSTSPPQSDTAYRGTGQPAAHIISATTTSTSMHATVRPPITVHAHPEAYDHATNVPRSLPEARQTAPEPSQCAPCCDVAPQACQPKQTQTSPAISARKHPSRQGGRLGMGVRDVSHAPHAPPESSAGRVTRAAYSLVPTLEVRKTRARGECGHDHG